LGNFDFLGNKFASNVYQSNVSSDLKEELSKGLLKGKSEKRIIATTRFFQRKKGVQRLSDQH
jgi:hypothetical protein